ncbi:hypothetical protein KSP40_PGU021654 [Platanthera guangdongensis]|uniref:Uncharacterized protein n=1 Tax=Platanthera guangdongensis TaxID=2320717 RepID=A0ABR2MD20_9ASPA
MACIFLLLSRVLCFNQLQSSFTPSLGKCRSVQETTITMKKLLQSRCLCSKLQLEAHLRTHELELENKQHFKNRIGPAGSTGQTADRSPGGSVRFLKLCSPKTGPESVNRAVGPDPEAPTVRIGLASGSHPEEVPVHEWAGTLALLPSTRLGGAIAHKQARSLAPSSGQEGSRLRVLAEWGPGPGKVVLKLLAMNDEKTKQKAIEAVADIYAGSNLKFYVLFELQKYHQSDWLDEIEVSELDLEGENGESGSTVRLLISTIIPWSHNDITVDLDVIEYTELINVELRQRHRGGIGPFVCLHCHCGMEYGRVGRWCNHYREGRSYADFAISWRAPRRRRTVHWLDRSLCCDLHLI